MLSNVKSRTTLAKTPKKPIPYNDPFKKGILVIPMIISGGFLYSTSNGLTDINNFDTNDFTWREIIADGQGDLQVCWENSTSIETKKETLIINGEKQEKTTYAELTYQVGSYCWGYSADLNGGYSIQQDATYNDFNVMFETEEISLNIKKEHCVGCDFKKFRFYCLPEVSKKKIFYISSLVEHRDINDSNNVISYDIVFTHITNKLQKSGKAIEEYFHFSPAGNGYAWPKVDREHKVIRVDENLIQPSGINFIQEEEYNAAIHNNTAFIGWELKEDDLWLGDIGQVKATNDFIPRYKQKFYSPKIIFPHSFRSGETTILNRKALPESDIIFINNIKFSEDSYTTWTDYWTQLFSNDFSVKYAGECSYKDKCELGTIDKLNNNFDEAQVSNAVYNQSGIYNEYMTNKTFSANLKEMSWVDVNMFNFYACKDIYTLPFEFTYHILNQPKQWPIIGPIFNAITGGYGWGWDEEYRRIEDDNGNILKNICGIASKSMIDIAQKNWKIKAPKDDKDKKFFINDFYKKDSDDRFNANNRSLILKYQLTSDLITTNTYEVSTDKLNTTWLGQYEVYVGDKDEEGNKILKQVNNGERLKLDGSFRVKINDNLNRRYVICGISNQSCFAESQKYTFYYYNEPKWVGAFLTNSNFRDNSRDWTNQYTLNSFNNLPSSGEKINYPIEQVEDDLQYLNSLSVNDYFYNLNINSMQVNEYGATGKIHTYKVDVCNWEYPQEYNNNQYYYSYGSFGSIQEVEGIELRTRSMKMTSSQSLLFDNKKFTTEKDIADFIIKKINNNSIHFNFKQFINTSKNENEPTGKSKSYWEAPNNNFSEGKTRYKLNFGNAKYDEETKTISLGQAKSEYSRQESYLFNGNEYSLGQPTKGKNDISPPNNLFDPTKTQTSLDIYHFNIKISDFDINGKYLKLEYYINASIVDKFFLKEKIPFAKWVSEYERRWKVGKGNVLIYTNKKDYFNYSILITWGGVDDNKHGIKTSGVMNNILTTIDLF